jgi:hypothetical protein
VSRCGIPITVESVTPPFGGESTLDKPRKLVFNQPAQATAKFTVPGYVTYTQPLWHPMRAIEDRLLLLGDRAGLAEEPRPLACTWRVDVGGTILTYSTPLVHRVVDPVKGEVVEPFRIVPALTLAFDRAVDLYPIGAHKSGQIGVVVENGDAAQEGTLTLEGPPGWTIRDNPRPFKLAPRESKRFDFEYEPGEKPSSGDWTAVADAGGRSHREGVVKIDYPHITPQRLYVYATAKLIASDIRRNGVRAGYIEGSGDDVPQALRELGFDVTFLDDEALTSADLSKLDVIVGGVRAYNTRPKLATAQPRLLEYVANGGTLVLQYNTLQELTTRALGPYPFEVSRERVTVEDSPVAFPDPEHPLLTKPNKITAADFEGWVQERGLYFAGKWDPKYSAPLEMADPGESKRLGSVLYVNYGKGVYIYTSLSLFRQLPEGVVGAYRLFANMVSARAQE